MYIRTGHHLPDEDGWGAGKSDPYVKVVAYNNDGRSTTFQTYDVGGNQNPTWNVWLDFGTSIWTRFEVRVYDYDPTSGDDPLSAWVTYYLGIHVYSVSNIKMNCYSGHIVFDYEFGS